MVKHFVQVRSAGAANPAGTTPQSANTSTGLGGIGQKPAASGLSSAPAITPEYLGEASAPALSLPTGFADGQSPPSCTPVILPYCHGNIPTL